MQPRPGYPGVSPSAPPPPNFEPPPPYQVEAYPPPTTSQRAPLIVSSINHIPVPYEHSNEIPKSTYYGPYSQTDYCPRCKRTVATFTKYKVGLVTWVASAACVLMGGFLGCCLIPCCTDFTRDIEHFCPYCRLKLGLHQRI